MTSALQKIETGCDIALSLVLLYTGLKTALIWHALTAPLPRGEQRIDLVDEINTMALILNLALPVAVLAFLFSAGIKLRTRTLQPLSAAVVLSGIVGVFACALVMYASFLPMLPGVNLWHRIWWRFGS
jgi:hypothetical protein